MRSFHARSVIVLGVGLSFLGAGCAEPRAAAPTAPEPRPPAPTPAEVPAVYDQRLGPLELTRRQKLEIIAQAAPLTPKGRKIWYVLVRDNRRFEGELSYIATVYFSPDFSSARLRKGKCMHVWHVSAEMRETSERFMKLVNVDQRELPPRLPGYRQVSLAAQPFGENVAVPEKILWPFTVDGEFTDQEVIEIVDFVRAAIKRRKGQLLGLLEFVPDEPVLSITAQSKGRIEVFTGTRQHWLAAEGHYFILIGKGGKLLIVKEGSWLS